MPNLIFGDEECEQKISIKRSTGKVSFILVKRNSSGNYQHPPDSKPGSFKLAT
jgi:hypothetical protein